MRRLFLMMGQSNMCDRGWASELPVFDNASKMFVYRRSGVGVEEIGTPGAWEQAAGIIDEAGANVGQVGALALGFMDKLCDIFPNDEVGVVPRSIPGTSINSFVKWNRNTGPYGMALERLWWAKESCPVDCEISGFLWWQGEADASSSAASGWSQKFSNIVSGVRVDTGKLLLPTVFVKLGNEIPSGMTYWNTIRQQQDWMTMHNLKKIDIDDVVSLSDYTHYPTSSYITIGERMATSMATML